jgi:hypothetical protein
MSALSGSLVQQPRVWANRARRSALLMPLAQRTDLIVLPETFASGFSLVGADGAGVAYAVDRAAIDFLGRPLSSPGEPAGISTVELEGTARAADRERFPAHLGADRFTLEP